MPRLATPPESHAVGTTLPARLMAAARIAWDAVQRKRRLRATIRTLHGLDDHSLKDIGLERHDIVNRAGFAGGSEP